MKEERKERQTRWITLSSLRIHQLSRVKLGEEKEVKPRIEGT
jgi:hypothetical protein